MQVKMHAKTRNKVQTKNDDRKYGSRLLYDINKRADTTQHVREVVSSVKGEKRSLKTRDLRTLRTFLRNSNTLEGKRARHHHTISARTGIRKYRFFVVLTKSVDEINPSLKAVYPSLFGSTTLYVGIEVTHS